MKLLRLERANDSDYTSDDDDDEGWGVIANDLTLFHCWRQVKADEDEDDEHRDRAAVANHSPPSEEKEYESGVVLVLDEGNEYYYEVPVEDCLYEPYQENQACFVLWWFWLDFGYWCCGVS